MSDSKIIKFPKNKIVRSDIPVTLNLQDVQENLDNIKSIHIQETINLVTPMLFQQLIMAGFDVDIDSDEGLKNGALIIEAIRSILYIHYDLDHPFQKIAEEVFVPKDNGFFSIKDKLDIILSTKPEEEQELISYFSDDFDYEE